MGFIGAPLQWRIWRLWFFFEMGGVWSWRELGLVLLSLGVDRGGFGLPLLFDK